MNAATRTLFNDGWTVRTADALPSAAGPVTLPHSWNATDCTSADYDRNPRIYRKEWVAGRRDPLDRWFLEFGAVGSVATVSVNGRTAGVHRGAYSRFRVDISPYIKDEEPNMIEVLVENGEVEEIYPLLADFTFCGGIYRDVFLVTVGAVSFDPEDHGSSGVVLEFLGLEGGVARVRCRAAVINRWDGKSSVTCRVTADDAAGTRVAEACATAMVTGSTEFELTLTIAEPILWQGLVHPHLYRFTFDLLSEGEMVDQRSVPFGLRFFHVDPTTGFHLNGVPYSLRGVCFHQDHPSGWGQTAADRDETMDFVREIGANVVRLAHYQHAEQVYEACDRAGLVVWSEIPYITRTSATDPTGENAMVQLRELIRQNSNHTSICFWGVQNEITMLGPSPEASALVERLHRLARKEDPTRLTTQAQEGREPEGSALNRVTDVTAYNRYFGWYVGAMEDFGPWADAFPEKHPHLAVAVSEYGCEGLVAYHSEEPRVKDYTEEYHTLYHETVYGILGPRRHLWGTFVWSLFDFASAFRDEGGVRGVNNKGLVTRDRKIRKDAFFFYKATWSDTPVLHITSRRFVRRSAAELVLKVYSNRGVPEVFVGDRRVPVLRSDGVVHWFEKIPLNWGENTLVARCAGLEDRVVFCRVADPDPAYVVPHRSEGLAADWILKFPELLTEAGPLTFPDGRLSVRCPVSDLLSHPTGRTLLERYIPHMISSPRFLQSKRLSLEAIAGFDPKNLPPLLLFHLNKELTEIPHGQPLLP